MTVSSHIFTCSYNRRRMAPQHLDESTMQALKSKINLIKLRPDSEMKTTFASENTGSWHVAEKEMRTSPLETEEEDALQQIFRRREDVRDEDHDIFVLKRANPVYDSDDEDYMASPPKRHRTTDPVCLSWGDHLSGDDHSGFTFSFSSGD